MRALCVAGSSAASAAPVLRELLERDGADQELLTTCSRLGTGGLNLVVLFAGETELANKLLAEAASVGDPATRTTALRLLHEQDPARALAAAKVNAAHADAWVRRWAGLVMLAEGEAVDALPLQAVFFEDEPLIRRRALAMLSRARVWPEPLAIAATDLLADRDPAVRRAAAAAFAAHPEQAVRSRAALREARAAATDPATIADLDRALARR
jgi:hypothetical protein